MSLNVGFDEEQKKIIADFITKVKEKQFLTEEDFDIVFDLFKEITRLEGEKFGFLPEVKRLDNRFNAMPQEVADKLPASEWNGTNIAYCDSSNALNKDYTLCLDPVFFCRRYFGREKLEDRLEGVVNLIFTIYHETHHALKLTDISRGKLSPETLNIAREILLRDLYDEEFYRTNYKTFSFENAANEYAIDRVDKLIEDREASKAKRELIEVENKKAGGARLGKINYRGRLYSKDEILPLLCENEIRDYPKLLYLAPILQRQYNPNGSKKGIVELFGELFDDVRKIASRNSKEALSISPEAKVGCFDCQTFYYEIIGPEMGDATEKEYKILAEKYGVFTLQSVLSNMEKYFNHKAQTKLQHTISDNDKYESEDEIKADVRHRVNLIVRFRNGIVLNPIAEKLLREDGFIRGTREFLDTDTLKRRKMFAASLVDAYNVIESEEEYNKRAGNEKNDIDEVINILYYNRLTNLTTIGENGEENIKISETVRFIHILKMSNVIGSTLRRGYFEELLRIPDVNRVLGILEKDKNGYLNYCIKKSKTEKSHPAYPKTEAEEGKYTGYILGEEDLETSLKVLMLNDEIDEKHIKRSFEVTR